MTMKPSAAEITGLAWFKSSHSSNDGPACVEVATAPDAIHVRDSKDKQGPHLTFTPTEWNAFIAFAAEQG
ncbi:DUF397 domain-containing protein [Streptomyces sp. ICBB 8177]|uniref:DUF397 domain-containing protein n=1 Tax=Streptomyces sp. ICBB 8177 TaxID=563922 RepID=UPI000D6815F1|nr:DUF397 domain-containing protein [Streptomyces sp. ICBB 8177]PWI45989.1 DUF397 domain-containing protein [Streptomyces sp. ICBB 8177]